MMTLENLLRVGKLKRHEATREEVNELRAAIRRNLADARIDAISSETRFDVAYKAIMQCALVAMMVHGFRPSTSEPGHHVTVIQSLPKTLGLSSERMIVLDRLRKQRNLSDYSGTQVTAETAAACIRAAESLHSAVEEWLVATHRSLIGGRGLD